MRFEKYNRTELLERTHTHTHTHVYDIEFPCENRMCKPAGCWCVSYSVMHYSIIIWKVHLMFFSRLIHTHVHTNTHVHTLTHRHAIHKSYHATQHILFAYKTHARNILFPCPEMEWVDCKIHILIRKSTPANPSKHVYVRIMYGKRHENGVWVCACACVCLCMFASRFQDDGCNGVAVK